MDNKKKKKKFLCVKTMHWKNLQKIPIEPHTIGYMCKELQIICSDYDDGMAHSKLTYSLHSNEDFPQFLKGFKKFLCS